MLIFHVPPWLYLANTDFCVHIREGPINRKETKYRSATLPGKVASTHWYVPVVQGKRVI
jgi:hypothetical protein